MINRIIKLLGYEYIDNIKITYPFKKTSPRKSKMRAKRQYYKEHGKYQSKIVLNKQNRLVDGYTTYLLEKERGRKIVKVKRI